MLITIYSYSTSNKKQLNSFKAKPSINFKVSNLKVVANYIKKVKSLNLSIKINIFIYRYNLKNSLQYFTILETNLILTLREFQKGYILILYLALLIDYLYINSKALVQNKRFTLLANLNKAF